MSTKSSIFYKNDGKDYIHFYEDMMYPADFFLNKVETSEVTYKFSLEELCLIARSIDLKELKRQSELTDEQIATYVECDLEECLHPKKASLFNVFPFTIYGSEKDTYENQLASGKKYFIEKRDRLKQLYKAVSAENISKIYFGMESIN